MRSLALDSFLRILVAATTCLSAGLPAHSAPFSPDSATTLPGAEFSAAAWGDYDSDGDLDFMLTGATKQGSIARIYRNESGVFAEIAAGLAGVDFGSVAWGDYDADGDLDVLLAGMEVGGRITRVLRNDGGAFADIGAGLVGVERGASAWGDYDNDGDLDILMAGLTDTGAMTAVYANDGGAFTDAGAGLVSVEDGAVAWGDYDTDGDLDVLLTGLSSTGRTSRIYRNDDGVFTDALAGLPGMTRSAVAWGDYDNDGDLDIVLTGLSTSSTRVSRVYRNDGGSFSDIVAGLIPVYDGAVGWGDHDNDGDLDILLVGSASSGPISRVYSNGGIGGFVDAGANLDGVVDGAAAWGDYDGDGDLDVLLAGTGSTSPVSRLYTNEAAVANSAPSTPPNPATQVVGTTVTFSWDPSTDGETPTDGLTYNLRIGTTPDGSEIMPLLSDPVTGLRRVVQMGNTGHRRSWTVQLPALGTYYWSVQAVDGAFAGSSVPGHVVATSFMIAPISLEPVDNSAQAWGDYDGDGDLDFVITGWSNCCGRIARIYRNTNGSFADVGAGLEPVENGAVAWGDYDGDGDLDLLLSGMSNCCGRIARLYRNNGGSFADLGIGLHGNDHGSLTWGDYDNDGDLDILSTGFTNFGRYSTIYRNQSDGSFADIGPNLEGVFQGGAAWGDYDTDGDLDVLLTGSSNCCGRIARVYQNQAGTFTNIGASLEPVDESTAAWGDYDDDGDLDVILSGYSNCCGRVSRVYRNQSGSFVDIGAGLEGVSNGSLAWGDYDNDGDRDIVLAGPSNTGAITRVYDNDSGVFTDIAAGLEGVTGGAAAWGDYDGDEDLDLLLTGAAAGGRLARVYANSADTPNSPPATPGGLATDVAGTFATLSWNAGSDAETPASGLTYNLRVGTAAGASDVFAAMSAPTGYRRVAEDGNTRHRTSWTIKLPGPQEYFWSVQAVDAGFVGSPFAAEESLVTSFSEIAAGLPGVYEGSSDWGDYDSDGDLDLVLTGYSDTFGPISRIYRNDVSAFTDIGANLEGVRYSSVDWGDYDRDGDLDILLAGYSPSSVPISRVYRNQSGTFINIGAALEPVYYSAGSWGDADNDGDLDILLTGYSNSFGRLSRVYRNDAGSFSVYDGSMQGVYRGSTSWGDYDGDLDLDVLLTGDSNCCGPFTRVYRNTGSGFSDVGTLGIESVYDVSSAAWGDYDGDGDLDVLIAGYANCCGRVARIYRNQSGSFADIGAGLVGVSNASVAWGDFDNDGDLDALVAGLSDSFGRTTRIYGNQSGTFADIGAGLEGVYLASVVWGDYDNDADLDILVTGHANAGPLSRLYKNNEPIPNSPPAAPTDPSVSVVLGGAATFSWDPAVDGETLSPGLTYNLRVGTSPGASDIMAAMASGTGFRRVVQMGNTNHSASWRIPLASIPLTSPIFFSVQGIDAAFAGSPFSEEKSFGAMPDIVSVADVGNDQGRQVRVRWVRSFLDALGGSPAITGYGLWRRVDEFSANQPVRQAASRGALESRGSVQDGLRIGALPPGEWDFIVSIPARGDETYSVVSPTLCDSTVAGICYSVFFVSAMTDEPTVFFDSEPDSGYSVDNLAPMAPLDLVASVEGPTQVQLVWSEVADIDLDYYAVYRGTTPDVEPSPQNRVGVTVEPSFEDTVTGSGPFYWVVTAFDFAGNESAPSDAASLDVSTSAEVRTELRFALLPNRPNPFDASTTIAFQMAEMSPVRLEIYDLRGVLVRVLLDKTLGAGSHEAPWDGRDARGRRVASGEYFYRLTAGSSVANGKMTLLQ